MASNKLNMAGQIGIEFNLEEFNEYAKGICERFGGTEIGSGFYIPDGVRDVTIEFADWYDCNMAAEAIKEEMQGMDVYFGMED